MSDILSDIIWYHSHVFLWQAVGRRGRGKQDIDIHLLKPARFLPDPEYVVPQSLRDNVVQDNARDPGHDYITYAYCTEHPVLQWLPAVTQAGLVDRVQPWQLVGDPPEAGQPMDSIRAECNHHWKSSWRRSWPPAHIRLYPMGVWTFQWQTKGTMLSV
jgi:hypothetical protein